MATVHHPTLVGTSEIGVEVFLERIHKGDGRLRSIRKVTLTESTLLLQDKEGERLYFMGILTPSEPLGHAEYIDVIVDTQSFSLLSGKEKNHLLTVLMRTNILSSIKLFGKDGKVTFTLGDDGKVRRD